MLIFKKIILIIVLFLIIEKHTVDGALNMYIM